MTTGMDPQVRRRANSDQPWGSGINWSRSNRGEDSSSASSEDETDDVSHIVHQHRRMANNTMRHQRGLLILFLIALYTTFGLRAPGAPQTTTSTTEHQPDQRPKVLRATHTDSRLPLARRRATSKQLVFKNKEAISAFYQQKAFHPEHLDVGWYVNCAALMGIAAWAVAEHRHHRQNRSSR